MAKKALPKYRHYKPKGLGFVEIKGKRVYLGKYNSAESLAKYNRIIDEIRRGIFELEGRKPDSLTVAQIGVLYIEWANAYYPEGSQRYGVAATVKLLSEFCGNLPVSDFGPKLFKDFRQTLIGQQLTRKYINDTTGRLKRMFKWAASEEHIGPEVFAALATVDNLKKNRSQAKESTGILPVPDELINATLPHLNKTVADMVRFQRLTSCRPGEVRIIRPCDVDRSGEVWIYRPSHHKTEHLEKDRIIPVGPKAQAILGPRLLRQQDQYCFPSNAAGDRSYSKDSYNRAIRRACIDNDIERWVPLQIRHTAATSIRKLQDLEAAQIILGHSRMDTTEIYAERNLEAAIAVARKLG